jgi:hypothetical protein
MQLATANGIKMSSHIDDAIVDLERKSVKISKESHASTAKKSGKNIKAEIKANEKIGINWKDIKDNIGHPVDINNPPPGYEFIKIKNTDRYVIRSKKGLRNANRDEFLQLSIEKTNDGRYILREGKLAKFTSSTRLGNNMKKDRIPRPNDHHQAHHLVPEETVRDHPLVQMAMEKGDPPYNPDWSSNGIWLPDSEDARKAAKEVSGNLPIHNGSHGKWNKLAKERLDDVFKHLTKIYKNKIPEDTLTKAVKEVENELRDMINDKNIWKDKWS